MPKPHRGRPPLIAVSAAELEIAAKRCATYRETHDLSQTQLAHRIKAPSASAISDVEHRRDRASSRVVKAILDLK